MICQDNWTGYVTLDEAKRISEINKLVEDEKRGDLRGNASTDRTLEFWLYCGMNDWKVEPSKDEWARFKETCLFGAISK